MACNESPTFVSGTNIVAIFVTTKQNSDIFINYNIMAAFNEYSERFLNVIETLGLSDYKVWNEVESLSKATMSKIRRGICGVSMNTLCDFVKIYQNVNADYIITGRGSMFIESETNINEDMILKLQEDLKNAYIEIGRLNMELKSAKEHNSILKRG